MAEFKLLNGIFKYIGAGLSKTDAHVGANIDSVLESIYIRVKTYMYVVNVIIVTFFVIFNSFVFYYGGDRGLNTILLYVFTLLLAVSHTYFSDKKKIIIPLNRKELSLFLRFQLDNQIIKYHLEVDFTLVYIFTKATLFFMIFKNMNRNLNIYALDDIYIFWLSLTLILFAFAQICIIFGANHPIDLKVATFGLGVLASVSGTIAVGLEFHKVSTDPCATYPLIPTKATYFWQKKILGYACLSREDLKVGSDFQKHFKINPPIDQNGFLQTDICIRKLNKQTFFGYYRR